VSVNGATQIHLPLDSTRQRCAVQRELIPAVLNARTCASAKLERAYNSPPSFHWQPQPPTIMMSCRQIKYSWGAIVHVVYPNRRQQHHILLTARIYLLCSSLLSGH